MKKLKIAVIGGGVSSEHEVSLKSAQSVSRVLREAGFESQDFTIAKDGVWSKADSLGETVPMSVANAVMALSACDAIFPLLHGPVGEDGTLAAFADLLGIPLVGSPTVAGALAMDKNLTKLVAHSLGIPVAPGVVVRKGTRVPVGGLPAVVKPNRGGSSHGVALVETQQQLDSAVEDAFNFCDQVLVEDMVIGREVDVAVFRDHSGELRISAPLEIVREGIFSSEDKYGGNAVFHCPAQLPADVEQQLALYASDLYETLGCRAVSRFDFFVKDEGPSRVVLGEVNTTPGMTVESQVPIMYSTLGLAYERLLTELIFAALP